MKTLMLLLMLTLPAAFALSNLESPLVSSPALETVARAVEKLGPILPAPKSPPMTQSCCPPQPCLLC